MLGQDARVRYSLSTNVITPFLKNPNEFGHGACSRVKGQEVVTQALKWAPDRMPVWAGFLLVLWRSTACIPITLCYAQVSKWCLKERNGENVQTLTYRVPRVWTQHYCIYDRYLCTIARTQSVNINHVCCGFHLPWFGSVVISLFTDTPVGLWCVYTQLCYRITIVPSILTLVFQWTQSGSPNMSHIGGHTVCSTCVVEGTFERKRTQKDAWV